jgi:hypothetical protein
MKLRVWDDAMEFNKFLGALRELDATISDV